MAPLVIGIGGLTRLGKTTLACGLAERLCGEKAEKIWCQGRKYKMAQYVGNGIKNQCGSQGFLVPGPS